MTDTHGVALICERHDGHTVAWVATQLSRHVPAGYFIESWFVGQEHYVHAGTLDGGYEMDRVSSMLLVKAEWPTWRKAAAWCQYDAQRVARILAMRVPITVVDWQATRGDGGAA